MEAGPIPIPCDAQASCSTDASPVMCCGGYCVDTAKDPANCGQCGNGCTANQFCTGTACDDAIIANLCANPSATVVFDPYDIDNEAGASMGAALHTVCVPATSVVQLPQTAPGVLDPSGSERPITGVGNTFIAGGGPHGQNGNDYMELEANLSPLYLRNDGTNSRILTRAGTEVLNVPDTTLSEHHDYFYVQLAVEPQSGTLCLSGVGILGGGTQAAGYYTATELIPHRANYTASWYVFEWQDSNNDSIAGALDTYTMKTAGP
jgi:Stigma-specific protein, Stig1